VLTGAAALRRHGLSAGQPGAGGPVADAAGVVDILVPLTMQRADVSFARFHRTAR
jgi:hypothetical protein